LRWINRALGGLVCLSRRPRRHAVGALTIIKCAAGNPARL
jgi:hypothetical protein